MNDAKSMSIRRSKNKNNDLVKESKHSNINEEILNIKSMPKKTNFLKPHFKNNQNYIESINLIGNNFNYKNIILNNMLTPSKKQFLSDKSSSTNKNNIKIERNVLFDNSQTNKNFRTLGQNKQKSVNKNIGLKLIINNHESEGMSTNTNNTYDLEAKYKLMLNEKNNLINKLRNEVEYYKKYYHNINMNMNIILPNNSNTIEAHSINRAALGLNNDKKNIEGENIRSRIKNIFSMPKKDIKFNSNNNTSNNLIQYNINDYNTIKPFVNKINSDHNINYTNSEGTKDFVSQIKNNFNIISDNLNMNSAEKKLLLSNDSLKNDMNLRKNKNMDTKTLNNIFYRSNSNTIQKKGRKLKLGFQQSELTLDINNNNNFNSIEANRNYNKNILKNKKHIIYSLNMINSKTGSDNEIEFNNYHNKNGMSNDDIIHGRSGYDKYLFNKILSSPSSLYKDKGSKILIDTNNNSGEIISKNDINNTISNTSNFTKFNYKENFDKLKQRMRTLVKNLFELIEMENKK